eukprot:2183525-Karenia_brevis.AAC.1
MRERKLAHRFDDGLFVPMLPTQSLKSDVNVRKAQHTAKQVVELDLPAVDTKFFAKWKSIEPLL